MEIDHQKSRNGIVSLLRGCFACPTIAALAESGIADRMLKGSFAIDDFPSVKNARALLSIFSLPPSSWPIGKSRRFGEI